MSVANHIILIAGMGTSPVVQTSYYNKWSEVCKISMWRTPHQKVGVHGGRKGERFGIICA